MARISLSGIKPITPLSIFGKSAIGLGSSDVSWYSRPKANVLSAQQMLALREAAKVHHRTFGDRLKGIGLGAAHPFEVGLHELLRTSTAVSAAAHQAGEYRIKKHHGSFLEALHDPKYWEQYYKGAGKGFHHPGSVSFSDVLKDDPGSKTSRWFKGHKFTAGAVGLGLDVVADPLTYLTLGTGAAVKGGEEAALKASSHALETGHYIPKGGGANVAALPELEVSAKVLENAGKHWSLSAELARKKVAAITAIKQSANLRKAAASAGRTYTSRAADKAIARSASEVAVAQRAAWAEHFNNTLRPIQIGFRLGKTSAKINTRIPLPKVGEALVNSNIPVLSKLSGALRKGFGAGKGDWERQMRVTRKHIVEERVDSYHVTAQTISKEMPKLSHAERVDAFHFYESPGGVIKNSKGQWMLNRKAIDLAIKAGKMSNKQKKFLAKWDEWSNVMLDMDHAAGIAVDHVAERTGGGYVPHIFTKDRTMSHVPNDAVRGMLKKAGYTRKRKGEFTLKRLLELHEWGKLDDKLESDSFKLMVGMSRAHANAQADQAIFHVMTDAFGVPAKIAKMMPQDKELAEAKTKLAAVTKKIHDRTLAPIADNPKGAKAKSISENIDTGERTMRRLIKIEKIWSDRVEKFSKPVEKLVKNPDAHDGLVTLKGADGRILRNAQGQKIKIEQEGADAFQRYERILRDPKERLQFHSAWTRFMGRWKVLVTAVNVGGYRLRNTESDFWNMFLSGVPLRSVPRSATLATNFMLKVKSGDAGALAEFMDLYHSGALSGVFGGDVALLAKELETGHGGAKEALKHGRVLKASGRAAQTFNRNAENWGRLTHYMYRTRIEKMSPPRAIQKVREAHFDYEDLTPTEQTIKGNFIPFYTWTRKDIPYQVKMLMQNPGRYAAFPKLVLESEKAAGTKGDTPPSYLGDSLAFKVPGLGYLTPQIGVSDVAKFQNPKMAAKSVVNMQGPVLKAIAELSLNKQYFTGQPIKDPKGHARQPISNWLAPLMSLIPGSDVGTTSRKVKGKQVFGQGASPYAMYFANQLPLSRYLSTSFNPITRERRGIGPELSYMFGLSTTKLDNQGAMTAEQLALQDRVAAIIKKLRDEGRYPQSNRKTSKNQQLILNELRRQLRRH